MNLEECIRKEIEKSLNEEYTNYKINCLEDLDEEIESKRNDIIGNVLNGVSVFIQDREEFTNTPAINIRIENKRSI